MTCIEFFDKESIEDICTCFAANADKVIFIGKDKKVMEKYILRYERVFADRGINIQFDIISVKTDDLNDIAEKIIQVIEQRIDADESFVFDLTGGDDLCLVAMGIVYERFKSLNIQMHRFNLRNNKITDCDADGQLLAENDAPMISIEENIRVFGGDIVYGSDNSRGCYNWDMNEEFCHDIDIIWAIMKNTAKYNSVRAWNAQISIFEVLEQCGESDALTTSVTKETLINELLKNDEKFVHIKGIIDKLRYYHLAEYYDDGDLVSVTYKSEQVKRCLTKAGQALELVVFLFALRATDKQGQPAYNDVMTGVYIDWDGDIHTEQEGFDTENEIDVMMMHGTVPVFISCKNGKVEIDELYKLNTVATKFGGKYARKILVATALGKSRTATYIRQRAKDMNIDLLEPIYPTENRSTACLSDEEFQKEMNHAWSYITRRETVL